MRLARDLTLGFCGILPESQMVCPNCGGAFERRSYPLEGWTYYDCTACRKTWEREAPRIGLPDYERQMTGAGDKDG
jgi:hypothetical protein